MSFERKNTTGTLNRNESQSQLATQAINLVLNNNNAHNEVELKAQSNDNSELF